MKTYKHSFANYPKGFEGTVISSHKICLQFKDVEVDLRIAYKDTSDLIKLPDTKHALPVVSDGVNIHILAVGCEWPVLEQLQDQLIESYIKYAKIHKGAYKRLYDKEFKDFVSKLKVEVDKLKTIVDKED